MPALASNFRSQKSLDVYLEEHNILGIAEIDTRRLTRILRQKGAQNGCIITADKPDENEALTAARQFPGLKGLDLAKEVTVDNPINGVEVPGLSIPAFASLCHQFLRWSLMIMV